MRMLSSLVTLGEGHRHQLVTVVAVGFSLMWARPTHAQCTVVDLGTLTGHVFSVANDINNQGEIVGVSGFPVSEDVTVSDAVLWTRDGVISLGALPGGMMSVARAINARGQVAGFSATMGFGNLHAFLWDKSVLTDLGTLPGHSSSIAEAISNRGAVFGLSFDSQSAHLVSWKDGVITDLGPLPRGASAGELGGLNNRGQIVGTYFGCQVPNDCVPFSGPFLWQKGVFTELPLLPGDFTGFAYDINERGQIVGASIGTDSRAVLWDRGTVTMLPTLLGSLSGSAAVGINNRGQIVGAMTVPTEEGVTTHAVLWDNGTIIDLGVLPGGTSSVAREINNAGTIVGSSAGASFPFGHAAAWTCQ